MFKPLEMKKSRIFLREEDSDKVTSILYDLQIIEFFSEEEHGFEQYSHQNTSELSSRLLSLRATIQELKQYYTKNTADISQNPIELTRELVNKHKEINEEIIALKDQQKRQNVLANLKVSYNEINKGNIIVGFLPKTQKSNLKYLKKQNELINEYILEDRVYFATKTKSIPFSFKEFYLPEKVDVSLTREIKEKEKKKKEFETQIKRLANGNLIHLEQEELRLSKKVALLEAKEQFSKTKHITVLSGYMPSRDISVLQRSLEAELGNKFYLEFEEPEENEDVPTLLDHSGITKHFESLVSLYSLPKSKEFDPTLMLFLIFPIFYGFILGDFGYGLISLLLFTFAKTKFPQIKSFLTVLQVSAISSMFFGIFYGEYFGMEPNFFPFEFHRGDYPEQLLTIALVFGAIHLNLGVLIGFFSELKKSLKSAIFNHFSWILLQISAVLFYFGVTNETFILTLGGWLALLITIIFLYLGHGIAGIIEIPSFFSNLLSYARLMAVGLSSIVIAVLINEASSAIMSSGTILAIALGTLMFIFGHAFNIVLGNFKSFIQALRLHYVEFFTKFYEGGGREFTPFGKHIHSNE